VPIPEFVARLRDHVGRDLLWLPGVAAVVLRPSPVDGTDEVLLVQRADTLAWTVVTGILDPVEEPAVGAVREVLEETGLTVRPLRIVGVYSDPTLQVVRYPDGNVWHYVSVCFECAVQGGELTTCDETLALAYVSPTRLPATLLPNHRIRIRDARSRRPAAFIR